MRQAMIVLAGLIPLLGVGCAPGAQEQIDQYVKNESRNLPKKMDAMTTMVALESKPLEIVYIYKISGMGRDQIAANETSIKNVVRQGLQTNKSKLAAQIANKVRFTYVYRAPDGSEAIRFTINTWEI